MTTVGVVAIVKDEAARIGACLSSLRPHLDAWTILDTGSTDDTEAVVRATLDGIPGTYARTSWDGFGAARSEAFALAHGSADVLVATDADMTWTLRDGWLDELGDADAGMVAMGNGGGFHWRLPLVLRGAVAWRSVGRCHEYTARTDGREYTRAPLDRVTVRYADAPWSREKALWQLALLEADLDADDTNPRTHFYLAQTLRELGMRDLALRHYRRRATMGGYEEERWYAQYRAALLEPEPVPALLAAWEANPRRLEPLADACRLLNERDLHRTVYALTATPAGAAPDGFFVHRSAWDWGVAFERHIAAWWVGERGESAIIGRRLLERADLPDAIRTAIERNLALPVAA